MRNVLRNKQVKIKIKFIDNIPGFMAITESIGVNMDFRKDLSLPGLVTI